MDAVSEKLKGQFLCSFHSSRFLKRRILRHLQASLDGESVRHKDYSKMERKYEKN